MAMSSDKMREALGKCITALMFEAERHANEQNGVALSQVHDAIMSARAALAATPPSRPVTAEPVAWRHKHWPNEPWQYREAQTFGTPYPYYEPLYAAPPAAAGREEIARAVEKAIAGLTERDLSGDYALVVADAILALGPAVTPQDRKWDEGEHEGCGIDSARAFARWRAGEWRPIETAPTDPLRDPPLVMLWVEDGGHRGAGTHAFGRCYRSHDGTIRGVASGFSGDWKISHWMPLPDPPLPRAERGVE